MWHAPTHAERRAPRRGGPPDPRGAERGRADPEQPPRRARRRRAVHRAPACPRPAARRGPAWVPRRDRPRGARPAAAGDGRRAPRGARARADRRVHRRRARPARRPVGLPPRGRDRLPRLDRRGRRAGPARVRRRPSGDAPGGLARGDVAHLRAPARARHLGRGRPWRAALTADSLRTMALPPLLSERPPAHRRAPRPPPPPRAPSTPPPTAAASSPPSAPSPSRRLCVLLLFFFLSSA